MSSPITAKKKGRFDTALIGVHQRLSHGKRIEVLARRLADLITELHPGAAEVRCLDAGCGDMQLAERIAALAPITGWTCIDIHDLPEGKATDPRWQKYRRFDGTSIPFPDRSFDVVLFSDVLHHAGENTGTLLAEAGRTGLTVVVKDHFERSLWSRAMLWVMDFVGNWGYGVAMPRRYFTRARFEKAAEAAGLTVRRVDAGIDLYGHLPLLGSLLRPAWQFIAVLTAK